MLHYSVVVSSLLYYIDRPCSLKENDVKVLQTLGGQKAKQQTKSLEPGVAPACRAVRAPKNKSHTQHL
jgi:hypothetical protein